MKPRAAVPAPLSVQFGRDRIDLFEPKVIAAVQAELTQNADLPIEPWARRPYDWRGMRNKDEDGDDGIDWYCVASPRGYAGERKVQPPWGVAEWLLREVLGVTLPQAVRATTGHRYKEHHAVVATWARLVAEVSWRQPAWFGIEFYGPRLYHNGLLGNYQSIMPHHASTYYRRDLLGQWHLLRPPVAAALPEDRPVVISYRRGKVTAESVEEPAYDAAL